MKKVSNSPNGRPDFAKKRAKLDRGRGERIESGKTPSGLKMGAGSSPVVSEFGTPLAARGQGKDDGSMLHKLPQNKN